MKKLLLAALVAALVVPAMAAPTVYLTAKSGNSPAYTVHLQDDGDPLWTTNGITTGFQTFCVEWDRGFNANQTYYATIDNSVRYGGGNGPLQQETQMIYAAFLNSGNQINDFSDTQVQRAIWYWESGEDSVRDVNNEWHHGLQDDGEAVLAAAQENSSGWQYVRVLNLWENAEQSGTDVQSQLVMVVPAPGAILLTGIGTTLVGLLRRRRAL